MQGRDVGGPGEQCLGLLTAKPAGRRAAAPDLPIADTRAGLRPFNTETVLAFRPGGSMPTGTRRNLRR